MTDIDARGPETIYPADWELWEEEMTITVRRIGVAVSDSTATLLAALLAHEGVCADSWISGHVLAEIEQLGGVAALRGNAALRPTSTPTKGEL